MYKSKSVLRLRYLKKRKKNYSDKILFKFNKIFDLIRGNFSRKKITIAVFKSGKIIITGGQNTEQVNQAFRFIKNILTCNYKLFKI